MDSFTENILARARQRQKLLQNYATDDEGMHQKLCAKPENKDYESLLSEKTKREPTQSPQKMKIDEEVNPQSPKNSSFNITGSTKTNTLNINKENFNMEIKVTSSENVRVEVEFEEESSDIVNVKHLGLRKDVKNKLNRLGKLYAGDGAEISSPIHRTEETFLSDRNDNLNIKKTENKIPIGKGLKGLASLAEDINHWEDDVKVKKYADKDSKNLRSKLYGNISVPASAKLTSRPSMISENSIQDKINVFNVKQKTDSPKKQTFIDQDRKNSDDCTKTLHLDPTLLNTLESQGFLKKTEGVNLIYDFNVKQNKELDKKKNEVVETKENKISTRKLDKFPSKCPMKTSIADRAHRFEPTQLRSGTPEPSSLPLSERKALFEKNSGAALLPKAPFGFAVPISENNKQKPENPVKITSVSTSKAMVKETSNPLSPLKSSENTRNVKNIFRNKSPSKTFSKEKDPVQENNPFKSGTSQATGIVSTMAALMAQKNTISQAQIENKVKEERKQDMDLLLNRFKRKKEQVQEQILEEDDTDESDSLDISEETPINYQRRSGSKRHSVSPKVASVLEDVKKIKVSPAKSGRLYPNLSDIEAATETEHEDRSYSPSPNNSSIDSVIQDDANSSFGREILKVVCKNQTPQKRASHNESTNSEISDILEDMDEYLNDALGDEEELKSGPTSPKQIKSLDNSQPSHSFSYKEYSTNVSKNFKSPMKPHSSREKSRSPTYIVDGQEVLPLTHTVSFYRKQTTNVSPAPSAQQVSRENEEISTQEDDVEVILKKIKSLQDEVNKQQLIIAQTSQALNLCNSTLEFMGSSEQVEAEKVLLLSTHRRQAILNEIQRLKVESTLRPQSKHAKDLPLEKGSLTLSSISLPLKKEYVRALAAAGGKGHHVVCLVKCGEQVVCSKLTSTVASDIKNPCCELCIPGEIILKDIYSDFTVIFEVYCLQAQEEILPHEVKYHIKKNNKATPKKSKHDSVLSRPNKESPAGPQSVRSPSFALMGYVVFSIQQMNKKIWSLNNTPTMSPLEGTVEMRVSCVLTTSIEHSGFLTMFEDISGFGAWHRRWCVLRENSLSYWKYPDDEKKVPPIDSIDLCKCITKEVKPVSRDICARLHTFLLETVREPLSEERDTLIKICKGDKTIIRNLLSADTKEDRIKWCAKLNSALTAVKLWGK